MEGAVPAGYEEYLQGSQPKIAAPMMPDTDGATVYDFTFDKVSARQAAGSPQHRHLRLISLIAKGCSVQRRHLAVVALALTAAACWHLAVLMLSQWRLVSELLPCC